MNERMPPDAATPQYSSCASSSFWLTFFRITLSFGSFFRGDSSSCCCCCSLFRLNQHLQQTDRENDVRIILREADMRISSTFLYFFSSFRILVLMVSFPYFFSSDSLMMFNVLFSLVCIYCYSAQHDPPYFSGNDSSLFASLGKKRHERESLFSLIIYIRSYSSFDSQNSHLSEHPPLSACM